MTVFDLKIAKIISFQVGFLTQELFIAPSMIQYPILVPNAKYWALKITISDPKMTIFDPKRQFLTQKDYF